MRHNKKKGNMNNLTKKTLRCEKEKGSIFCLNGKAALNSNFIHGLKPAQ